MFIDSLSKRYPFIYTFYCFVSVIKRLIVSCIDSYKHTYFFNCYQKPVQIFSVQN